MELEIVGAAAALLGAVAVLIGLIERADFPSRVRRELHGDADLIEKLGPSPSREILEELVEVRTWCLTAERALPQRRSVLALVGALAVMAVWFVIIGIALTLAGLPHEMWLQTAAVFGGLLIHARASEVLQQREAQIAWLADAGQPAAARVIAQQVQQARFWRAIGLINAVLWTFTFTEMYWIRQATTFDLVTGLMLAWPLVIVGALVIVGRLPALDTLPVPLVTCGARRALVREGRA